MLTESTPKLEVLTIRYESQHLSTPKLEVLTAERQVNTVPYSELSTNQH